MEVLKEKAALIAKKHLKAIAMDVNEELVPAALDMLKERISGPIDDVVIEAVKPALKAALAELIEQL